MAKIISGPPCAVCGKPSQARSLCPAHYTRWRIHGHLDATRPPDWGKRRSHPLSHAWRNTIKCPQGRDERWNDLWPFVEDVGDRPSPRHVLRRLDKTKPWGPSNFYWREPLAKEAGTLKTKSEYAKAYRDRHPERHKGYDLKKKYGITVTDYDRMLEDQNGGCAICGEKDGTFGRLAVDHCHDSKKVRGLLCSLCNRAIGALRDSVTNIRRAADYVERHQ